MRIAPLFLAGWMALAVIAAETADKNTTKNTLPPDAELAWKEVENASKPPPVPLAWGNKTPTKEEREEFEKFLGEQSFVVAEKAREFLERFPDHAKAADAQERERFFLRQAVAYGNKNAIEQVEASLTDLEKLQQKVNAVHRRAMEKQSEGPEAVLADLESGIRELMKEYPDAPELWQQLLSIVQYTEGEKTKQMLVEIIDSKVADEQTIARAKGMLKLLGAVGRPFELSFTAVDGREVDVQQMRGKVVLVDFWASWCGPCMVSLPEVIELYDKYHEKGFEIIGINMDQQKRAMENVVNRYNMRWPQYFDGKGWGTKYALEFNITGIPAMWLVDKRGILRSMEARRDLEGEIKKLLAESDSF